MIKTMFLAAAGVLVVWVFLILAIPERTSQVDAEAVQRTAREYDVDFAKEDRLRFHLDGQTEPEREEQIAQPVPIPAQPAVPATTARSPREILSDWPEGKFVAETADAGFVTIPANATRAELENFASRLYPACRVYANAAPAPGKSPSVERGLDFIEACWQAADEIWPGRDEPLKLLEWNQRKGKP